MSSQGMINVSTEKNGISTSAELPPSNPREVFAELLGLLDEYGPNWYTEEHQSRALKALQKLEKPRQRSREAVSAA